MTRCAVLAFGLALLAPPTASMFFGASPRPTSPVRAAASAVTMMAAPLRTVKLGLVGGGTVGGGIVEILKRKEEFIKGALNCDVQVAKVVVGNIARERDWTPPAGCTITDDVSAVLDDPEIDIVVEVMGGTTLAKDVVNKAIAAGKHVVTANKALIAAELPALESLLTSVNAEREEPVQFGFEAAVCGGIPIIHALQRDFLGDDIVQLSGIINGCTNFMLSQMSLKGLSYSGSLAEASELGYAEADPTLDVGGFDARSKLKIMIKLAFGIDVDEDEIPCRGITEVTTTDFEYAGTIGGTVKLLGIAKLDEDDPTRLSAFVSPVFVSESSTLAGINGATNAVQIASKSLQSSTFVGQGAGRFPTANSCVSDILAIAAKGSLPPFPKVSAGDLKFVNKFSSSFYVRIRFRDSTGIIKEVGEIFAKEGVSIYSVLQNPIEDPNDSQFVVMTDTVEVTAVKKACAALEATDWCIGETFFMPVL